MWVLRRTNIPFQVSADLEDAMAGYGDKVATFRRRDIISASNDSSSIVRGSNYSDTLEYAGVIPFQSS